MAEPNLSIVLTNRNNGKYLKLCIDSIIKSTKDMSDKEIIVVDDASTDNTFELMQNYVRDYKNITILTLPINMGLAVACNVGVSYAKGEWIMYTNEDTVFPLDWEDRFYHRYKKKKRLACCNLIEPGVYVPVAQGFTHKNIGTTVEEFKYDKFIEFEKSIREKRTIHAMNGPQLFSKKDYMSIGGCDPLFQGVSFVDTDFFIRWRLNGFDGIRTYESAHYHFSGKGGRLAGDVTKQTNEFTQTENSNAQRFISKWGFMPYVENGLWCAPRNKIRGIDFSEMK